MAVTKKRTATKKQVILPMVPSQLIDIAIKDMRKALAKKWVINMSTWYNPKTKVECKVDDDTIIERYTVCSGCAAGSVMAFSLANANQLKVKLEPDNFKKNSQQLLAIDHLRQGEAAEAAVQLGLIDGRYSDYEKYLALSSLNNKSIPYFDQQKPEPFFKAMKAFSAKLKKAGY